MHLIRFLLDDYDRPGVSQGDADTAMAVIGALLLLIAFCVATSVFVAGWIILIWLLGAAGHL